MAKRNKVGVGDPAPDFTLPDQKGEPVSLSDLVEGRVVVLYFYPRDDTAVCTAQACGFRDSYEAFREAGAEVVGISSDPVESHEEFAAKHSLPFRVLSDDGGKVRRRYDATGFLGLPGRITFVIDSQGVVRHRFSALFNASKHIEEAMEVVRSLV